MENDDKEKRYTSELHDQTQRYGKEIENNLPRFIKRLLLILEGGVWRKFWCKRKQEFMHNDDFRVYVESDGWNGLGLDALDVYARIKASTSGDAINLARLYEAEIPEIAGKLAIVPAKQAVAKGEAGKQGANSKSDNITITDRGTSAEYTIRRLLKEDREDLVGQILDGELSANAAAIEAGFRPKSKTFSETMDIRKVIANLNDLYQPGFIQALKEAL